MPGVEEILGEAGAPLAIAASADHVYWPTSQEGFTGIARCNLDGSSPEREWLALERAASGLAIEGNYLYFGRGDSIAQGVGRVKLDGSELIEEWAEGQPRASALAADAVYLYYAWQKPDTEVTYIARRSFDGEVVQPEWIELGESVNVGGITVTGFHVYWTVESTPHGIGRAAIGGGSVEPEWLITGVGQPTGITHDDFFLYWLNQGTEIIYRLLLQGPSGLPEPGPSELEGLKAITWRNGVLYWALEGGRIYRYALEEGPPEEPLSFTLSERIFFLAQRGLPFPVVSAVLKVTPAEVERILSTVPRPEAEEAPDE